MTTEIKVWEISNRKLKSLETSMEETGRKEKEDLEQWIKSNPDILGQDILIIGEQVYTKSGPLDFLGIDRSGNTVIIELKRGKIPREALTQVIDYASDVESWDIDKLSEECIKYKNQELEDFLGDKFENLDLEELSFNKRQRILLVGTYIEESLERMIYWLSGKYGVSINAIIFKYIKTKSGDEILAKTTIIPEELEKERTKIPGKVISMSDRPGSYEREKLESKVENYLSEDRITPRRIKEVLLPLCLRNKVVSREQIIKELIRKGEAEDEWKAALILTTISRELGIESRDYLRQIIRYKKGRGGKYDYELVDDYKNLVKGLLEK